MSTAVCRTSRRGNPRSPAARLQRTASAASRERRACTPTAVRASRERSAPTDAPLFAHSLRRRCLVCCVRERWRRQGPLTPRTPLGLCAAMSTENGDRAVVGTVCARGPTKRSTAPLAHMCTHSSLCTRSLCVCASWVCRALPKNRGSRARAIPRATPPVPHAPIPCAPPAARFAPRRGVGGDDGRPLRLSTSPASSEALEAPEGPAEAARRRLPRVLALAGRGS